MTSAEGKPAPEQVCRDAVSLVLLPIIMPEQDGIQFFR